MTETVIVDAASFLVARILNTTLPSAYALASICSLAFVISFYPDRVFVGGRRAPSDRIALVGTLIAVFLLGITYVHVVISLTLSPYIALLIALVLTTTANFAASRWLPRRKQSGWKNRP